MRKLYKKDTKGKIRILVLSTIGDTLIQKSGLLDGKLVVNTRQCSPKNLGKINETTGEEQALAELASVATKKLKEGYFSRLEDASIYKVLMPMLAKTAKLDNLKYPVYLQPKLDGMRALYKDGELKSRKNRVIDTVDHVVMDLENGYMLDGELYAHGKSFQDNMKLIKKTRDDTILVQYHVYDMPDDSLTFLARYNKLKKLLAWKRNVSLVPMFKVTSEDELLSRHSRFLEDGYEGTMIRTDDSTYEFNKRSNSLLKLKDFIDETYKIIDVIPSDRLPEHGVVVCQMINGNTFKCGMKLSHEDRIDILINKKEVIGKTAEVRFFEYTDGGLPRFPVYHGWRLDK